MDDDHMNAEDVCSVLPRRCRRDEQATDQQRREVRAPAMDRSQKGWKLTRSASSSSDQWVRRLDLEEEARQGVASSSSAVNPRIHVFFLRGGGRRRRRWLRAVAAESKGGDETGSGAGASASVACPAFGGVFSPPVKTGPNTGDTFPSRGLPNAI
jgi:hypothetical protein